MVHTFATLEPRENFRFFLLALRRNKHRNGPADGFLGRVAEQALSAFVPTGDNAVKVFADDGVVRGIDNRSQRSGDDIGVLPLGHVFDREENHLRRAVVPFQPPGVEQHRAPPDLWKVVRDLEVVEEAVAGQNVFEQDAQFGNIPLLVA